MVKAFSFHRDAEALNLFSFVQDGKDNDQHIYNKRKCIGDDYGVIFSQQAVPYPTRKTNQQNDQHKK